MNHLNSYVVIVIAILFFVVFCTFIYVKREDKIELASAIALMPIVPGMTPLEVYENNEKNMLAEFNEYMSSPRGRSELLRLYVKS